MIFNSNDLEVAPPHTRGVSVFVRKSKLREELQKMRTTSNWAFVKWWNSLSSNQLDRLGCNITLLMGAVLLVGTVITLIFGYDAGEIEITNMLIGLLIVLSLLFIIAQVLKAIDKKWNRQILNEQEEFERLEVEYITDELIKRFGQMPEELLEARLSFVRDGDLLYKRAISRETLINAASVIRDKNDLSLVQSILSGAIVWHSETRHRTHGFGGGSEYWRSLDDEQLEKARAEYETREPDIYVVRTPNYSDVDQLLNNLKELEQRIMITKLSMTN